MELRFAKYNMGMFKKLIRNILDTMFPVNKSELLIRNLQPSDAHCMIKKAPQCPVQDCQAIFAYKDDLAQTIVWNIKYKRCIHSAEIAGFCLHSKLIEISRTCNKEIVILPMPITKKRRKERGYNQCELILHEVQKLDLHEFQNRASFKYDLLIRTRHLGRQTLKSKDERESDAKGLFSIQGDLRSYALDSTLFIVVDDVITTGSTMRDAKSTLTDSGAVHTLGLAIAH